MVALSLLGSKHWASVRSVLALVVNKLMTGWAALGRGSRGALCIQSPRVGSRYVSLL